MRANVIVSGTYRGVDRNFSRSGSIFFWNNGKFLGVLWFFQSKNSSKLKKFFVKWGLTPKILLASLWYICSSECHTEYIVKDVIEWLYVGWIYANFECKLRMIQDIMFPLPPELNLNHIPWNGVNMKIFPSMNIN